MNLNVDHGRRARRSKARASRLVYVFTFTPPTSSSASGARRSKVLPMSGPPSTPFKLERSFPNVIITYCSKTDGGRGEERMWQIANFLKQNGITSFNGKQVEAGQDWMQKWLGKMPEADVCLAMISGPYFESEPCKEEIYKTAREKIPSCQSSSRRRRRSRRASSALRTTSARKATSSRAAAQLAADARRGPLQGRWEANLAKLLVQVKKYVSADGIGPPEHDVVTDVAKMTSRRRRRRRDRDDAGADVAGRRQVRRRDQERQGARAPTPTRAAPSTSASGRTARSTGRAPRTPRAAPLDTPLSEAAIHDGNARDITIKYSTSQPVRPPPSSRDAPTLPPISLSHLSSAVFTPCPSTRRRPGPRGADKRP